MKIYVVTEGSYSDYCLQHVLSREAPVTSDERKRIAARHHELAKQRHAAHDAHAVRIREGFIGEFVSPVRSWRDALILEFGFQPVEAFEVNDGCADEQPVSP